MFLNSPHAWKAGEDFSPARSAGDADIQKIESRRDDRRIAKAPRRFQIVPGTMRDPFQLTKTNSPQCREHAPTRAASPHAWLPACADPRRPARKSVARTKSPRAQTASAAENDPKYS